MGPTKKKGLNGLDFLASKNGGSIDYIDLVTLSKFIPRILKDIICENITSEDFEKYRTFFCNRQYILAFREFAQNKYNNTLMYKAIIEGVMNYSQFVPNGYQFSIDCFTGEYDKISGRPIVRPIMIDSNVFNPQANGLFNQIRDTEHRKNNLWSVISSYFITIDQDFDDYLQTYFQRWAGFQSNLRSNFKGDALLIDK